MILITGASGGIGEATARAFARKGKSLYLIARQHELVSKIAQELTMAHGIEVHAEALDISSENDVRAWSERESDRLDRVEVLVNNAGLAKGLDRFQDSNPSDWDAMIDTNVKGLLRLSHLFVRRFLKRGSGHIVNLGSVAGHWPYPNGHVYNATKYAVHALSQAFRMDLLGTPVRVTEISPGMVETGFSRVRLGDEARAKAVYAGMTPLRADDVAEAIVWSVERPAHVNIQEIVLYPTDQASPTLVHRSPSR